jgi:hypothetical protein
MIFDVIIKIIVQYRGVIEVEVPELWALEELCQIVVLNSFFRWYRVELSSSRARVSVQACRALSAEAYRVQGVQAQQGQRDNICGVH